MNRKTPPSPPVVKKDERPGWVTEIRKYKIITPLYGGGEETQKADSVTTVRATEVRGHLRFWWRATRGGLPEFQGELEKMRKQEEVIWGSSAAEGKSGQSNVVVFVTVDNAGKLDHPFEVTANANGRPQIRAQRGSQVHPYAAFPLQPEQREARPGMETKSVRTGVVFTLEIKYQKDYKEDVHAALWAWEFFGGIGARTRRGFGALQCTMVDGFPPAMLSPETIEPYIKEKLQGFNLKEGVWHPGVPHLSNNTNQYVITAKENAPLASWYSLIESLKKFRQMRRDRPGQNHQGRSYWPEPEVIRALTDQRFPEHQPLPNAVDKFPRAKFGLPIIFHFKDSNRRNPDDRHSDPHDTTLQGKRIPGQKDKWYDRLASPLILRPIACAEGAVGLAAILEWEPKPGNERYTPPGGLVLKDAPGDPQVFSDLEPAEAAQIPPLNGEKDVLQAFLDFLN